MHAAALGSITVIDLLPKPKREAFQEIEKTEKNFVEAITQLSAKATLFANLRAAFLPEQKTKQYQKIINNYTEALRLLSEIFKKNGNFLGESANDFIREAGQNKNTIILHLPDLIPVSGIVEIYNLRTKLRKLFLDPKDSDFKIKFINHEANFIKMCSVDLPNLVEQRETIQFNLRSKSTNSNLTKALSSIKDASKCFGVLDSSFKLSGAYSAFYEKIGGIGSRLYKKINNRHYRIEYSFNIDPVFSAMVKNYGGFLDFCFGNYRYFSSLHQEENCVRQPTYSFVKLKNNLMKLQGLFEHIDSVFDFLKSLDVHYLLNNNSFEKINPTSFENIANESKQAIKSIKIFINCLNGLENSNHTEGKNDKTNRPTIKPLKIREAQATTKTNNRVTTASPSENTVVAGTQEHDDGLDELVKFFDHLFKNDPKSDKPKFAQTLENCLNTHYFDNENSCFRMPDILKDVDAFWASRGLSVSELVAGEHILRQKIQNDTKLYKYLESFNSVVAAFKQDIVSRLELYKKSNSNTLANLEALFDHDEIQSIDKPVFLKLAANKSWLASWTIRFKPTARKTEYLCELHIHYPKKVTCLDDLRNKKASWTHIKKTTGTEVQSTQLPNASDGYAFLEKAKNLLAPKN